SSVPAPSIVTWTFNLTVTRAFWVLAKVFWANSESVASSARAEVARAPTSRTANRRKDLFIFLISSKIPVRPKFDRQPDSSRSFRSVPDRFEFDEQRVLVPADAQDHGSRLLPTDPLHLFLERINRRDGVAIDGQDHVADAQVGQRGHPTRLDLRDQDAPAVRLGFFGHALREGQGPRPEPAACIPVPRVLLRRGGGPRQLLLHLLGVALAEDVQLDLGPHLPAFQQGRENLVSSRSRRIDGVAVDADDDVADFQAERGLLALLHQELRDADPCLGGQVTRLGLLLIHRLGLRGHPCSMPLT